MKWFLEKIIGSYSDRELKRIMPIVDKIEELELGTKALSDDELKNMTSVFKKRLSEGETLDDILPEAFAVVREATKRVIGNRHFKVQLIGGIVLHQGRISEMKTGEGKTQTAALALYLNALEGKGAHLVTVNDYLAAYQGELMGKIYNFLGLTVGVITHDLDTEERRAAYACDITYGTNNEFGFDYLRDNMVTYKEEMVQRDLNFAIVDEVDSILIDEARTPLIISGAGEKSTDLYKKANTFVTRLKAKVFKETDDKQHHEDVEEDYIIDEKAHTAVLTEHGIKKAEQFFGLENLSDPDNITISHHINQGLKAHGLMKKDIDYVVNEGEIIIVDEFTGRMMYGRRYSDGLHQAIEAKENVKVERESKTLATITFQNYFRMYTKLAGMTGTALTEEQEFNTIYKLDVIVIPTNMPMARKDNPDSIYKTEKGKFDAIVKQAVECHKKGQPILIGTISIEKSEHLGKLLKISGVPHNILNAKYHDKEAEIIAQAGKFGAVTIATNMAGRGTDIILGGNPEMLAKHDMKKAGYDEYTINIATNLNEIDDENLLAARAKYQEIFEKYKEQAKVEREKVVDAGGLYIIGTERHESRRIDNQLRGRAGRQGDIGESKFYISLEDDLMRLFGSDRLSAMFDTLKIEEDQPIEANMLSGAIENAQKKVEGRNFDIRKHVLQFDDVMNKQREIIYAQRRQVLNGENLRDNFVKMFEGIADYIINTYCAESPYPDNWDWDSMRAYAEDVYLPQGVLEFSDEEFERLQKDDLKEKLIDVANTMYEAKENEIGSELMRELERVVLLRTVDEKWMDHIDAMDQLKYGIGLRAYGQRDPVIEYKFEGFQMFEEMIKNIQEDSVRLIFRARLEEGEDAPKREKVAEPITASHGEEQTKKPVSKEAKVGRNDLCPCGSGKKYKKCHGAE